MKVVLKSSYTKSNSRNKVVIIATELYHVSWVENEELLSSKVLVGVICDGPMYKGRKLFIGGGNSGRRSSISCYAYNKVTVIQDYLI